MKQVLCPGQEIPIVHQFFGLLQCLHCLYGIGETPVPRQVVIENCLFLIVCCFVKCHNQAIYVYIAHDLGYPRACLCLYVHREPHRVGTEKSDCLEAYLEARIGVYLGRFLGIHIAVINKWSVGYKYSEALQEKANFLVLF